jgi:MGT family glycosyltransferase
LPPNAIIVCKTRTSSASPPIVCGDGAYRDLNAAPQRDFDREVAVARLADQCIAAQVRFAVATRVLAGGLPALNQARSEQDLPPLSDWAAQLLGVQAICVLTAPELDFATRAALPANVSYVGPAFEPYAREWTSPWSPMMNREPLIVLSFSTSFMDQQALAQRALDAVAGLPVRALLTAGPALDPQALRVPANGRVVSYVPHRTVFPHASLVVTHAGWQTVNAALAHGVPLVCIPDGRDQPDNAARVVACGAGVRVAKNASPRKLRHVIAQTLDDAALRRGEDGGRARRRRRS